MVGHTAWRDRGATHAESISGADELDVPLQNSVHNGPEVDVGAHADYSLAGVRGAAATSSEVAW